MKALYECPECGSEVEQDYIDLGIELDNEIIGGGILCPFCNTEIFIDYVKQTL